MVALAKYLMLRRPHSPHLQQEVLLLPRLEVRKHSTSPWCRAPRCSAGAVAVGAGVGVAAVAKGGDGAIPVQEQGQVVLRQRRNPDRR